MNREKLRAPGSLKRATAIVLIALIMPAVQVSAQAPVSSVQLSIAPYVDIPLPPDSNLFGTGGGAEAAAVWDLPFCRPLAAGVTAAYRLAPIDREDLGNPGSLTLLSAAASLELRVLIAERIDLGFGAHLGYFYTFMTANPASWATNLTFGGGINLAYRIDSTYSAGVSLAYRNYVRTAHLLGIGLQLKIRL